MHTCLAILKVNVNLLYLQLDFQNCLLSSPPGGWVYFRTSVSASGNSVVFITLCLNYILYLDLLGISNLSFLFKKFPFYSLCNTCIFSLNTGEYKVWKENNVPVVGHQISVYTSVNFWSIIWIYGKYKNCQCSIW